VTIDDTETAMNFTSLRLTLTGRGFCLMPLSKHVDTACTGDVRCDSRATHRLLSRRTASIELLCDAHAETWSRNQTVDAAGATSLDGAARQMPQRSAGLI
jgi:hypothetical protein